MIKRQLLKVITIISLIISVAFSVCNTSYAYTEEEKQQAKAWLSAHGYSPDAGGASQAYADYLNGKFDEELGVDVNGDGIPAAAGTSEDASTQDNNAEEEDSDWTDAETDVDDNSEGKTKKQIPGNNTSNSDTSGNGENTASGSTNKDAEMAGGNEDGTLKVNLLGLDEDTEQVDNTISAPAKPAKLSRGMITLYQRERMDTYKEAAEVVGISLLLAMVIHLLLVIRR